MPVQMKSSAVGSQIPIKTVKPLRRIGKQGPQLCLHNKNWLRTLSETLLRLYAGKIAGHSQILE